jgi:AcrR family transcriptional regulator
MDRNGGGVKGNRGSRRSYDSSRRREQARQTRERVLDAALARFLSGGFAATTVASIAADADTSPDTIYKSFGGKAGLIRGLCERALQGQGPVPAEERSDHLQETEPDPRRLMQGLGRLAAEVAPRGSPLMLLLGTAGDTDPELATLRQELDDLRLTRMKANARRLHRRGLLRPGISVDEAAEICWLYSSPEVYGRLVMDRGWSLERYASFVGDALAAALLPDQVEPGRPDNSGPPLETS